MTRGIKAASVKRLTYKVLLPVWRFMQRGSVTILMVHGVMDDKTTASWTPLMQRLTTDQLDQVLAVLARWYRFVSLDQAVDLIEGRTAAIPHSLVVTLDDGYRNNLTHAWPILRKHGVSPTMFLSTGHTTRREPFWFDRMDYVLQNLPSPETVRWQSRNFRVDPQDRDELGKTFRDIRHLIKAGNESYALTVESISNFLSGLEERAGCRLADISESDPWTALATWDELNQASREGVGIGSHTVDHVLLDKLDAAAIRRQLVDSKREIESRIGKPCSVLCYPNGNYSQVVQDATRDCGYSAATTVRVGANRPGRENLYSLRRNAFPGDEDETAILAATSGLADYLHERRSPGRN